MLVCWGCKFSTAYLGQGSDIMWIPCISCTAGGDHCAYRMGACCFLSQVPCAILSERQFLKHNPSSITVIRRIPAHSQDVYRSREGAGVARSLESNDCDDPSVSKLFSIWFGFWYRRGLTGYGPLPRGKQLLRTDNHEYAYTFVPRSLGQRIRRLHLGITYPLIDNNSLRL